MSCPFSFMSSSERRRIAPLEKETTVEIRPNRYLRIQHLNASPRGKKFENEKHMEVYHKFKGGIPASGPLTVPRRPPQEHVSCDRVGCKMCVQAASSANTRPYGVSHHSKFKSQTKTTASEEQHVLDGPVKVTLSPSIDKDMVIFFIHGVGGSSEIWCAQARYFSDQGYEIVAPDLIGHGYSCTPRDAKAYHFKEIAADMEEIFDRYCKKKNILVGHSYGASFATSLARNHPRHVTKLILISGGPPTPLAPQPGVFSLPYCIFTCIRPCLLCGFYKGAFHNKRTPVIPKEEAFNIPAHVLQHTMNGQDWPDGDELYHRWLTCPTLLIYGSQDQLVSLSEEEYMSQVIYSSQLEIIQDAGHMVMLEAPEEVNHLIAEFISQPVTTLAEEVDNNNSSAVNKEMPRAVKKSKNRKSLKSAKCQRSLPHNLLSKSISG